MDSQLDYHDVAPRRPACSSEPFFLGNELAQKPNDEGKRVNPEMASARDLFQTADVSISVG
jgi:hypothetical protein